MDFQREMFGCERLKVACASEEKLRETVHADQVGGPQLRGLVPASC
jgi:hypothetical protein